MNTRTSRARRSTGTHRFRLFARRSEECHAIRSGGAHSKMEGKGPQSAVDKQRLPLCAEVDLIESRNRDFSLKFLRPAQSNYLLFVSC